MLTKSIILILAVWLQLSEVLEYDPTPRLGLDVVSLHPEWGPGGVRMEVGEAAVPDLRHPGLGEPQVTRDSVLDTAHCRYGLNKGRKTYGTHILTSKGHLGKHVLPLILVVHVHAGQEDAVSRVGVDPAQEDDVLLVVDVPHVLNPVHGAAV